MLSQVTLEIFFLGLGLTVNIKKVQKQDLKNIKNVKRWHAKKYANKVGIMHESKGKHIGKAPSLHLFHTAVRQCMGVFLKRTSSLQPLLAVHGCSLVLKSLLSSSHMAWEQGYKFTNFTAVASFSGHFLAPPTWPGNEEHDPAFVSVQLGMFASYIATK